MTSKVKKNTEIMKRLIQKLRKAFAIFFFRQSANRKVIDCTTLSHAEFLWQQVYLPDGWDIEKPISVAWSWRLKDYCYRFVVKRKTRIMIKE